METTKETFTIRTPEQVGFQYVLAGVGSRFAAFLVDTVIRAVFAVFIFVLVVLFSKWLPALNPTGVMDALPKAWIAALGVLAYGLIDLGYFLLFEAFWSGQTPGKRLQGLRVIRQNGQPVGWSESSVRNILRAVDILAGVYPLGLIVVFLSRSNQRIGDYAAGTVVIVERRRHVARDRTRLRKDEPGREPDIEFHISRLESEQYRVLRSFLQRREDMDQGHRRKLARLLALRLMDRWGISASGKPSYEAFIEKTVALYEQKKRAI